MKLSKTELEDELHQLICLKGEDCGIESKITYNIVRLTKGSNVSISCRFRLLYNGDD